MTIRHENPVRLVKELKGAPLAILVLLSYSPLPVSREWIEIYSGYSDKPVSKALYYLQENGFILKTASGWIISDGSQQIPLPIGDPDPLPQGETPIDGDSVGTGAVSDPPTSPPPVDNGYPVDNYAESVDNSQPGIGEIPKNRKISESPLVSINLKPYPQEESKLIPTNGPENRKNSESTGVVSDPPNSILDLDGEVRLVAACLAEHGISLNRRTRRLLDLISIDDIYKVVGDLAQQGKQGETGLLVVRLEQIAALGVAKLQQARPRGDFHYSQGKYRHLFADYEENESDLDPPEIDMDPEDNYDPI